MRWLALVVAALLVAGGCAVGKAKPAAGEMARDTVALAAVLPLLSDLEVVGYRNQDWCQHIEYSRGYFTTNFESSTCNRFDVALTPFDAAARTDFDQLAEALGLTGVDVRMVDMYDGAIHFDIEPRAIGFQYWAYVYEPGYQLPADMGGELEFTRIDDNWYFEWMDWM